MRGLKRLTRAASPKKSGWLDRPEKLDHLEIYL